MLQNEVLEVDNEISTSEPSYFNSTFDPYSLYKFSSMDSSDFYARKPLYLRSKEKIAKTPFKVLDAPALKDDFYLNLIDWSSENILAVGLGS